MLKLRSSVVAFRSERRQADNAAGVGWLKTACIVSAFCVAAGMPAAGQGFTTIYDFAGYLTESGAEAYSGLIQATDGNFYGTTFSGGSGGCSDGCGTIYKVTANGAVTVLYSFQTLDSVQSGLIQASDGNFYGTTGNTSGSPTGTVYQITPEGRFTTFYSFNQPAVPGGLIQGSDGNFYGSTYVGGPSSNCNLGCGTIFQLTPAGTLNTIHSFSGSDGSQPGVVMQASDGNFYGVTHFGGAYGHGTIYKLTADGTLTTLYNFSGADGNEPVSLIQVNGENFYGVTAAGGANNGGTVFGITPTGTLTTVYNFCSQGSCRDGNQPVTLMQASDGNLYGTTTWGGYRMEAGGTIFEISGGVLTTIYKFTPNTAGSYLNGESPDGGLVQAADGNFYGTTVTGGTNNNCGGACGTVFTFGPAAAKVSTTALNFGNRALTETSTPLSLTLKNNGVTVLNVRRVALNGEFAIATNTCTGALLTWGQECKVTLTFTPTSLGLQTATLSFMDNAGSSPQTVSLSGTGAEPAVLRPPSLGFGTWAVGTQSTAKTFILTNTQSVALTNIAISTTGDFAVSATTCTTSLAPNGSCTISLTFTPTSLGARTGQLSVGDSASNSPQTSALTGTGAEPATLMPASLGFGTWTVGTTSTGRTFTLTNYQSVALPSIAISTTGDFAVSATTCTTSLAGQSKCTINVTFTPTATGTRTGKLRVSDSANNSPQTSNLTGIGK